MSTLFKTEPYKHQAEGIERFKDAAAFALFWEMGTGKTKTTIDIAVHKYLSGQINRVLLIAPNEVHAQWINEQLPAHCSVPYNAFVYETKHTDKYISSLTQFLNRCESSEDRVNMHWLAVHVEAFQYDKVDLLLARYLRGQKPFWIVDEATRIKNPEAKSVARLCALKKKYGGQACILTGTSIAKSPLNVWQPVEFISKGYMGCTYTAFSRRHAVLTKHEVEVSRGGRKFTAKVDIMLTPKKFWQVKMALKNRGNLSQEEAYINLGHRFDLLAGDVKLIDEATEPFRYKNIDQLKIQLSQISSAIKKSDCLDLPEKQYQEIELKMSPEQARILADMKKYAVAMYGDKELTVSHKAVLQTRALQVLGGFFPHLKELSDLEKPLYSVAPIEGKNAKLDYILKDIEELGEQPFIVWAVFVEELNMLHREINKLVPCGLLSGSTSKADRSEIVNQFKSGQLQAIVANPEVAGYGLNFQHALVQYWYSRSYRTESRLQAEDRSHRIGTAAPPLYKDLVYNCEFEKAVLQSNKEGRDMNDYFNSRSVSDLFT